MRKKKDGENENYGHTHILVCPMHSQGMPVLQAGAGHSPVHSEEKVEEHSHHFGLPLYWSQTKPFLINPFHKQSETPRK